MQESYKSVFHKPDLTKLGTGLLCYTQNMIAPCHLRLNVLKFQYNKQYCYL